MPSAAEFLDTTETPAATGSLSAVDFLDAYAPDEAALAAKRKLFGITWQPQAVPAAAPGAPDPNEIEPAGPWSTSLTSIGLPRPFPNKGASTTEQAANAVFNFPVDAANFLLSPAGAVTSTVVPALPAIIQRAVAAGFTVQQAWDAYRAGNLQDRLEAIMGAALGGLGVVGAGHGPLKAGEFLDRADPLTNNPEQITRAPSARQGGETANATQTQTTETASGPGAAVLPEAVSGGERQGQSVQGAEVGGAGGGSEVNAIPQTQPAQSFVSETARYDPLSGGATETGGLGSEAAGASESGGVTPPPVAAPQVFKSLADLPPLEETLATQPPFVASPAAADLGAGAATTPEGAIDLTAPTAAVRLRAFRPDGGYSEHPLVQFIQGQGGLLSKSAAREKWGAAKYGENKSLWDDAPQFPDPRHNKVYNAKSGQPPDFLATAAAEAGLLPPGADASTLWRTLQGIGDSSHRTAIAERAQAKQQGVAERQTRDFTAAVAKQTRGEKPVHAALLNVGDTVKVRGETLKVTAIDPETFDVKMEDGSKFGVQHVQDGTVFYAEHAPSAAFEPPRNPRADLTAADWQANPARAALINGSHIVEGAAARWEKLRATGATDAQLQSALANEFGTSGMSAPRGTQFVHVDFHGGNNPRIDLLRSYDYLDKPKGKPERLVVKGKQLLELARETFGISEPKAEAAAPAQIPSLRPGENQGDLLSKQTEDLSLVGEKGIDYAALQAEANTAAAAHHDASIWQEQNQIPFGFGPGAAASGEKLGGNASQIAQLTQTVTAALKTAKPAPMQSRLTRAIQSAKGAVVTAKQRLAGAQNSARATWLALKNGFMRAPLVRDYMEAKKDWQGADQYTSHKLREWINEVRANVRDPLTREGITNFIQADGDMALLAKRAAASNAKYRPGYEAALRLTPEEQNLAANIRQYFDAMLQDGINAGLLDHGIENYINQVWKKPNKITQELQASLQAGKLQTSFQFARKRIFESFFDGEQAGYIPASKDVSALLAAYDMSFNRALAARAFIRNLRDAKAADGEPVAKFSGMTQPIPQGATPPEAYLIRSRSMPEGAKTADGRPYQIVDHPALRGWKFVVQDGAETPAYHQVDMLVHPDHARDLRNVLGTSAFREGKLGAVVSPFLKTGAILKQTKLSLSIFHLDQEGLHGLFHRVNPANLERINFDDPKQWALVRGGLQVADYRAMELFSEGLRGGGLVSKIPVLGELQNRFNEWLFKDYIPKLKMTMALHAFDRNVGRYGKELSTDQIAELTARQGNAAFGELNYKLLGRSSTMQDFMRLTVLAPDFLEARGRFVAQALKPYGREQQVALMLGAATMYVTARALNQWLDNDPHWNKPFSVIYNGREWRLRTVMGDVTEAFTDPRRFLYNRFSPWLKLGTTAASKRDYRGVKLSNWEVVKDALNWLVPLPAGQFEGSSPVREIRNIASDPTKLENYAPFGERILGSAGVSNKPAPTAINDAFDIARKFKEKLAATDPKIAAEVKRADQETYAASDYQKLLKYLREQDREAAGEEIATLMRNGKSPTDMMKYFGNLPMQPFTGSRILDARMMATATPAEKFRIRQAMQERAQLSQRFFPMLRLTIQADRAKSGSTGR